MNVDDLNAAMAESNRKARRGRAIARLMFILTVGLIFALAYAIGSAPPCGGMFCPMSDPTLENVGSFPIGVVIVVVGIVGLATGLFWMWRILSADPEPDARSWRSRHRS